MTSFVAEMIDLPHLTETDMNTTLLQAGKEKKLLVQDKVNMGAVAKQQPLGQA
jgi:hypothetical protein